MPDKSRRMLTVRYESGAVLIGPLGEDGGNRYVRLCEHCDAGGSSMLAVRFDGTLPHGVASVDEWNEETMRL